jgi:hypothetical protein
MLATVTGAAVTFPLAPKEIVANKLDGWVVLGTLWTTLWTRSGRSIVVPDDYYYFLF